MNISRLFFLELPEGLGSWRTRRRAVGCFVRRLLWRGAAARPALASRVLPSRSAARNAPERARTCAEIRNTHLISTHIGIKTFLSMTKPPGSRRSPRAANCPFCASIPGCYPHTTPAVHLFPALDREDEWVNAPRFDELLVLELLTSFSPIIC